ncbi:hypothetical protein PPL_00777 [Heterostelium album PN500]|uniref:Uncharacterized protein n=1 Tax=Heterostelium pallidum (strain ATCC 26659 / Pp 5 / PN500) TaxID=670386 RepID=D3AXE6_HETP5|nr:hypothetical protein PPL_00777 [Heterostelium album PN500]EFA86215.1 hypothetical protein PPL_00777 [Heterostelium album PN500]|eukprot:XP_020438320.1 hypothetical protein PPL_00777 [Heterostelium album PN500]
MAMEQQEVYCDPINYFHQLPKYSFVDQSFQSPPNQITFFNNMNPICNNPPNTMNNTLNNNMNNTNIPITNQITNNNNNNQNNFSLNNNYQYNNYAQSPPTIIFQDTSYCVSGINVVSPNTPNLTPNLTPIPTPNHSTPSLTPTPTPPLTPTSMPSNNFQLIDPSFHSETFSHENFLNRNVEMPWFCVVNNNSPKSGSIPLPNVFSSFSTPLFRNFYHNIEFFIPDLEMQRKYHNQRVYISDVVGYSGNAKKFINTPQPNEVALFLEAQVLDTEFNPLPQCTFCKEYFQSRFYFANNPQCKEKLVLVKSNVACFIKNGMFSVQIKIMCCSKHHNNNSLVIHLWLRDAHTNEIVMSSVLSSFIKQWKRSKTP